jgi:hypothetical protein
MLARSIWLFSSKYGIRFSPDMFTFFNHIQAANGYSALEAGMRVLPYSLGSSLASIPAAWLIGYLQGIFKDTRGQNFIISAGLMISALGFGKHFLKISVPIFMLRIGLQMLLREHSSLQTQILIPLLSGIGIGMLFHAPYQVFVRYLKPSELATATSAFFLVRFTGATTGLVSTGSFWMSRGVNLLFIYQAVAGAVFNAGISGRLPLSVATGSAGIEFNQIVSIEPLALRLAVLHVISTSIHVRTPSDVASLV